MQFSKQEQSGRLELKIDGRIDSQWSDHFARELDDAIRNGHNDIHLDMSAVSFMSSAGIRVLLKSHKQLSAIEGSLVIINPSDSVKSLLTMSGLLAMFHGKGSAPESHARKTTRTVKGETAFEVFASPASEKMSYRIVGNPGLLASGSGPTGESTRVAIQKSTLALGVGAFGEDHNSCTHLFGEFLAAAGSAIYLPPGAAGTPDYLLAAGSFTPDVQMLYAAVCEGPFSNFLRFETNDESASTLSHLAGSLLEISGYKKAAVAMIAESAGLIGAALRKSPAELAPGETVFSYPDIRQWLSFSPERVFDRSLSLVVGILSTDGPEGQPDPFLRTIGNDSTALGHFHSATFSYAPIARGQLSLEKTLETLFEKEALQGVIHLLSDNRDSAAAMESEFKRGAIWLGELA